jgi:hypothetical protein
MSKSVALALIIATVFDFLVGFLLSLIVNGPPSYVFIIIGFIGGFIGLVISGVEDD